MGVEELLKKDNDDPFIQTEFGYCYYCFEPYPFVYNLYVHPEYRGKGHSRTLLEYVIGAIRKTGYTGSIKIEAEPREGCMDVADLMTYYESLGLTIKDWVEEE